MRICLRNEPPWPGSPFRTPPSASSSPALSASATLATLALHSATASPTNAPSSISQTQKPSRTFAPRSVRHSFFRLSQKISIPPVTEISDPPKMNPKRKLKFHSSCKIYSRGVFISSKLLGRAWNLLGVFILNKKIHILRTE